jgi:hypothetical protein
MSSIAGVPMKKAIILCLTAAFTLGYAKASDEFPPGKNFRSVILRNEVQGALSKFNRENLLASIEKVTLEEFQVRHNLYSALLLKIDKNLPELKDLTCFIEFSGYMKAPNPLESKKGNVYFCEQREGSVLGTLDQIPKLSLELLAPFHHHDLKAYLGILLKNMFFHEIILTAVNDADVSTWVDAEYEPFSTREECHDLWESIWVKSFPIASSWDTGYLIANGFTEIDVSLFNSTHSTKSSYLSSLWNLFSNCRGRSKGKLIDDPYLNIRNLLSRALSFAITPRFQAVFNDKTEMRLYRKPILLFMLGTLHPCATCRKDINQLEKWIPATERKRVITKATPSRKQRQQAPPVITPVVLRPGGLAKQYADEKEVLAKQLDTSLKQVSALRKSLEILEADKTELAKQLKKQTEANQLLVEKGDRTKVAVEVESLKTQLVEQNKLLDDLKEEHKTLQRQQSDGETMLSVHTVTILQLRQNLKEKEAELTRLTRQLEDHPKPETVVSLKGQTTKLQNKLSQKQELMQDLEKQLKDKQSEVIRLLEVEARLTETLKILAVEEGARLELQREFVAYQKRTEQEKAIATGEMKILPPATREQLELQGQRIEQLQAELAACKQFIDNKEWEKQPEPEAQQPTPSSQQGLCSEEDYNTRVSLQAAYLSQLEGLLSVANTRCYYLNNKLTTLRALNGNDEAIALYVGSELFLLKAEQLVAYAQAHLETIVAARANLQGTGYNNY